MAEEAAGHKGRESGGARKALSQDTYAWYRRYPGRALSGMMGLNPEQRGVYCTIIELCYEQRGALIDNDVKMAAECECDVRRYRRIKADLLEMGRIVVDRENGVIYDERAVRELVAAGMFSESQAKRAQHSNKKSTKPPKAAKTARSKRSARGDKPEVLPNVQQPWQEIGPISQTTSLKDNENVSAKRVREESSSTESPEPNEQARPPSPLIGGGRASRRPPSPFQAPSESDEAFAARCAAQEAHP